MQASQADMVGSIMSAPVQIIPAHTTALDALQLAEKKGMHHFPVFDGTDLVGLVCTCDLEDVELTAPVERAIQRSLVAVDIQSSWTEAARAMRRELVGSVLVTLEGHAVGIVTREDLCRAGLRIPDGTNFSCDSCGASTHLRREESKGLLCLDCRSRSNPESSFDETGVSG